MFFKITEKAKEIIPNSCKFIQIKINIFMAAAAGRVRAAGGAADSWGREGSHRGQGGAGGPHHRRRVRQLSGDGTTAGSAQSAALRHRTQGKA